MLKHLFRRWRGAARDESQSEPEAAKSLAVPDDLQDAGAWDRYWKAHLGHGFGPQLFDMFTDDSLLIEVMRRDHLRSVLCVGNGISIEPRALAVAGFTVVALDISGVANAVASQIPVSDDDIARIIGRRGHAEGGSVEFITGDIMDPTVCKGPYDVIVERRTAQNYGDAGMPTFLTALTDRLATPGILVSHCHDGGWRPGSEPRHATRDWFRENKWVVWEGSLAAGPTRKHVAWLFTSTG